MSYGCFYWVKVQYSVGNDLKSKILNGFEGVGGFFDSKSSENKKSVYYLYWMICLGWLTCLAL